MIDDELTTIRARADAATDFGEGNYFEAHSWGDGENLAFNLEGDLVATEQQVMADKAFLEHARRDVLALLAEVERLRKITQFTHWR